MYYEGETPTGAQAIRKTFDDTFEAVNDHAGRYGWPVYDLGVPTGGRARLYIKTLKENGPPKGYVGVIKPEGKDTYRMELMRSKDYARDKADGLMDYPHEVVRGPSPKGPVRGASLLAVGGAGAVAAKERENRTGNALALPPRNEKTGQFMTEGAR